MKNCDFEFVFILFTKLLKLFCTLTVLVQCSTRWACYSARLMWLSTYQYMFPKRILCWTEQYINIVFDLTLSYMSRLNSMTSLLGHILTIYLSMSYNSR